MDNQKLIKILSERFQRPVEKMEKFQLGNFSDLMVKFGTTDLSALPGNPMYEEIINKGIILGYNERRIYNGEFYGFHWGIDILSPKNTPVFAVDDGIVEDTLTIDDLTEEFGGETYGNYIVLSNQYESSNVLTLYGHLANLNNRFSKGQKISKGDQLGVLGQGFTIENGGWPPHLHFQVATSIQGMFAYGGPELKELTINPEEIFRIK